MKRVLLITMLFFAVSASAQQTFSEGTITFDVLTTIDGKQVDGLTTCIQMVKGAHYRSDLISSIGKATTIFDTREGAGVVLRDFGSQKIMIPLSRENWKEMNKKFTDLAYEIGSDTIALLGYSCSKATAVLDGGTTIVVYFTKSLLPDNAEMFVQLGRLPGIVLAYSATSTNSTVTYTAKSLSFDPVQIQKFDIPTGGYRVMAYEESKRRK